jgi:hypothetical protein
LSLSPLGKNKVLRRMSELKQDESTKTRRKYVTKGSITSLLLSLMEAASTSKTSVNFYQTTRRKIPEDSHENLKSYQFSATCDKSFTWQNSIYMVSPFHGTRKKLGSQLKI